MVEPSRANTVEIHKESEPVWRSAMWGRLSRGFEHKLNNLQALLVAAETMLETENAEAATSELRGIMVEARDYVATLVELFATRSRRPATDLCHLTRALASILSSISYRVTFATEAPPESIWTPMRLPVARHAAVLAGLCAHSTVADGGSVSLSCTGSPHPELTFVTRPHRPFEGHGARVRSTQRDEWREIHGVLAQHGGAFIAEATDERMAMVLRFPRSLDLEKVAHGDG